MNPIKRKFLLFCLNNKNFHTTSRTIGFAILFVIGITSMDIFFDVFLNNRPYATTLSLIQFLAWIGNIYLQVFIVLAIFYLSIYFFNGWTSPEQIEKLPEWAIKKMMKLGFDKPEFFPIFEKLWAEAFEKQDTHRLINAINIVQRTCESEKELLSALKDLEEIEVNLEIKSPFRERLARMIRG